MTDAESDALKAMENKATVWAENAYEDLGSGDSRAAIGWALLAIDSRLEALALRIGCAGDDISDAIGAMG